MIKEIVVKRLEVKDEPETRWILPSGFKDHYIYIYEDAFYTLTATVIPEREAQRIMDYFSERSSDV